MYAYGDIDHYITRERFLELNIVNRFYKVLIKFT